MTNVEKFIEVFGFMPDTDPCIFLTPCPDCKYCDYEQVECSNKFWNDEYKEVKHDNG